MPEAETQHQDTHICIIATANV